MPKFTLVRAAICLALLVLVMVAGIFGGAGFQPDIDAIRRLQAWRTASPDVSSVMIAITQLGSAFVTIGIGLVAAGWLVIRGERPRALVLAGAVIGERLLLDGLKLVIERARPALDAHPVMTHSSSFPSGHAGNTMAVFLSIALIASPPAWRRHAVILAATLSIVIGVTRPYLGVHWPSDVVAGWALGIVVALLAAGLAGEADLAAKQQH